MPIPLEKGSISINAMSGGSICRQGGPLLVMTSTTSSEFNAFAQFEQFRSYCHTHTQQDSLDQHFFKPVHTTRVSPTLMDRGTQEALINVLLAVLSLRWGHLVALKCSFGPPVLRSDGPKFVMIMQSPDNRRRRSTCQARHRPHRSDTEQGNRARRSNRNL